MSEEDELRAANEQRQTAVGLSEDLTVASQKHIDLMRDGQIELKKLIDATKKWKGEMVEVAESGVFDDVDDGIAGYKKLWEYGEKLDKQYKGRDKLQRKFLENQYKEIQGLKKTDGFIMGIGKRLKGNAKEWAKQTFKDPSTGKMTAESAATGAKDVISDPKSMLKAMGPWGILIGLITDAIDGMRKMKGEFIEASAASGNFAKSIKKAGTEAATLSRGGAEFMRDYGLTITEVSGAYKTLKATGIASLGAISPIVGQLSKSAKAVIGFSKAAGESQEVVAGRMASMIRSFGVSEGAVTDSYEKIIKTATAVAQSGAMEMGKYMQTVFSLADAFKEVGVSVGGINKVLSGVTQTMTAMGRPMENIQKVAQGIMGISKASEGWKVFMAKMSGIQGGYAKSLFAQEQRGAGFQLPGAGKFDVGKMINMGRSALMRPTQGIADAGNRQLMIEKLGAQMGMDTETTQVFQKLSKGAITEQEAAISLKEIDKATREANMSQKGMFDILKNILVGLIAKPLAMIYQALAGETEATRKMMQGISSLETPQAAMGAVVKATGKAIVHKGETITPNAKVGPYKGQDGGGGANFTFNMNIDEKSLRSQFRDMENKTVDMLARQQKANYVG